MSQPLDSIPLKKIDGSPATLAEHAGKVLLIVNVASQCGLTAQYAGLEALYERYRDQGLVVLGFPANDFAGQEPGSDSEIAEFCTSRFGVQFPMYGKLVATGPDKHPLYAQLTATLPDTEDRGRVEQMLKGYGIEPTTPPEVVWNFEKFLIGRDGKVLRRFAPDTAPDAEALTAAIEAALSAA